MKKIFDIKTVSSARGITPRAIRYSLALFLIANIITGCKDKSDDIVEEPPVEVVDTDITALVKKIQAGSTVIREFKSDTFTQIADGVSQTQVSYIDKTNLPVKMFILEVDLKNAKLGVQALLPYNDYLNGLQTVTEMCRDNQKAGKTIIAAVNGDFFSAAGAPEGYFYIDGVALKTARLTTSKAYFAVMKDKTPVIGGLDPVNNTEVPGVVLGNIQQAVSGRQWLVKDGALAPFTDFSVTARTAIGYTAANVVYAIVVDGAQDDYSNGISIDEMGRVMQALGTTRAMNLSGGVNSTLAVKSSGENKWIMQNQQPKKAEALVANGIGFVINE